MSQLFWNLLLAHVIGDFYCQTGRSCTGKREQGLLGIDLYVHAFIILVLSWAVTWSWAFWWGALVIGVVHLFIDAGKAAVERTLKVNGDPIYRTRYAVWPFVVDQLLHIALIAVVAWWWSQHNGWSQFAWVNDGWLMMAMALLLCWKPANLLTKHILRYCQVKILQDQPEHTTFKSGALIGTLERWLIVFFMFLQQYEAIGFLVAAKSILRFSETKESEKSEYVLAGTLVSIAIAVACGILVLATR
ncbi:MAG: DUF3307 domain-containing protein [Muribaculaceae bacterium]|nr:DUF3307 domain-containing protein [Muribaculaceae bacterium]